MPDVEKVINGLLCCINNERATPDCMRCPYAEINGICNGLHKLHGDAIALLKAQEPVEPTRKVIGFGWRYFCGKCGNSIVAGQNFCQKCGRAVKW
jgi:hypothetical protein